MNDRPQDQAQSLDKLRELIADIEIASLVTLDGDGMLRSRPMATQPMSAEPELWFFTTDYTAKVDSVLLHPHVCLSYAAPDKSRYVSVSGTAELVRDPERVRAMWNPLLKAWFPRGVDDPDLALLRVDIVGAQYWDAPGGKLVQLFAMVKAIATGESAAETLGHSEKLTVRSRVGSDTAT